MVGTREAWTDVRVQELRRLHSLDWAFSQIAQGMYDFDGARFTRNAIIGKATRIGLPLRGVKKDVAAAPRIRKPASPKPRAPQPPKPEPEKPAPAFVGRVIEATAGPVPFHDLQNGMCKFECSGQDYATSDVNLFRFCGKPAINDGPYCAACARISYLAPSPRRRVKAAA